MAAEVGTRNSRVSLESLVVRPPSHPTYDLKGIIKLALSEDAGDRGSFVNSFPIFLCMSTSLGVFVNFSYHMCKKMLL